MRQHELKTNHSVWAALDSGDKKAEFRLNDREFEVGDVLLLTPVDNEGNFVEIEPNQISFVVTHIVHGPAFGIPENYCMMSIERTFANSI